MTDGAAKTLEVSALKSLEAFHNLTSRDPHQFFTSGQWMTEKLGKIIRNLTQERLCISQ